MKTFFLFALTAAGLFAADATGTWTGSLIVPSRDGGEQESSAYLILKQSGAVLTGSVGPDADEQYPIQAGKVEDGTVTFEVPHQSFVLKFALKLKDPELAGEVLREKNGETQRGKIAVKREGPAK